MNYVEYGKENDKVIVFLHGGGLGSWNYRAEAELLKGEYHVVLPSLSGHEGSDKPFESIRRSALDLIGLIDEKFGGKVFVLGGLSLGAQVVVETLVLKSDIAKFAVVESASVVPSKLTKALISPSVASSFRLIKKKWFSKLQFDYLKIKKELFNDYYSSTCGISKRDMIAFLKANLAYKADEDLRFAKAKTLVIVGGKEQRKMLSSARIISGLIKDGFLSVKDGLYHGEYSLNYPERYVEELLSFVSDGARARENIIE